MKYSHKNPRPDSFYWRGSVLAVGHKNFCDEELARARIQVTEADGNVSFQPVVQRTDPNLTVYEDVEQILLKEGLDSQVAKRKLKSCPSSQQNAYSELEIQDDYNEQGLNYSAPNEYAALHPNEVSQYLEEVENVHEINFDEAESNNADDALAAEYLETEPNLPITTDCAAIEQPKCSSTPANKKLKQTKTINPQDVKEKKLLRADLEAANAIKEAAAKITDAAAMIVSCMQELKPEIKSLANRNYREIQMSANAVKQLVSSTNLNFFANEHRNK